MEPTPRIFNATRRRRQMEQRLALSAEEYCDLYKLHLYLQDVVKIILDKREDKPADILQE